MIQQELRFGADSELVPLRGTICPRLERLQHVIGNLTIRDQAAYVSPERLMENLETQSGRLRDANTELPPRLVAHLHCLGFDL